MWTPSVASAVFALALSLSASSVQAARDSTLGLSASNLRKNGIAVGFIPAYGEAVSPGTASSLNEILPKPMSVVGAYAGLKAADLDLKQLNGYVADILKLKGPKPPLQIALMPEEGYGMVTTQVAERIAKRMAGINAQGIPVWLRYSHEMNGDWYVYGGQPEAFIASWKRLTAAVRIHAPETYGGQTDEQMIAGKRGGWTPYWPGDDQVDIVGLSFYHYGGFERLNKRPQAGNALKMMRAFDMRYGSARGKPIILSETSGSFARNATTGQPSPGGASEFDIKMDWLKQITSQQLREAVPSYKALCWFEIIKNENAGGNSPVKTMDFRVVTGDQSVKSAALEYLSSDNLKRCPGQSQVAKRERRSFRSERVSH